MADANQILASLQGAFEEFKKVHAEQIGNVKAKFDDVVTLDKLDKVNAHVGDLQDALDKATAKMAAIEMGGAGGARTVKDADYTNAFLQHIRRGDVNAALSKGTSADGGFLAPNEWDRTITDRLVIISPMRQISGVQTISTGSFSKLFNLRGTASGWVGETAARPETTSATFGSMTFTLGEIYSNIFATQQLLDDALVDLESWIAGEVDTEFAEEEGIAAISGTGANGRPNGLLTFVTGGTNAATNPLGAITLTNSGAAAALTADGLLNLVYALPSAFTANAQFIMNRNTMRAARLLKDTTNQYLWQPSYSAGQPQTLAGYPVTEMAAMPDVSAGLRPIAFGDFRQGYLLIDGASGMRILRDPFTNKPYVTFYVTKRVGGGVVNPEAIKVQNISV